MVDLSKIRTGDTIQIRLKVTDITHRDGEIVCWGGPFPVYKEMIVKVEPRPLAIGDKVCLVQPPSKELGTVLGVHENFVWVLWPSTMSSVINKGQLERIE